MKWLWVLVQLVLLRRVMGAVQKLWAELRPSLHADGQRLEVLQMDAILAECERCYRERDVVGLARACERAGAHAEKFAQNQGETP